MLNVVSDDAANTLLALTASHAQYNDVYIMCILDEYQRRDDGGWFSDLTSS